MNNKKKKMYSLLLIFILFLTSCRNNGKIEENLQYKANKIRIHYYNASVGYAGSVYQLMMHNGILSDMLPSDVAVEWVDIPSGPDARDALVSGQIDIAVMSGTFVISALENDLPLVLLSNTIFQTGNLYSANPDIKSIDDIKAEHKLYTITVGNIMHLSLMLIGKENYGDAGRFNDNLITMGYPELFATLETSSDMIDCAIITFPNMKKAEEIENLNPILDLTPIVRKYGLSYCTVTSMDFYNDNPELIEIFYEAIGKTIDFMNQNTDEAARILAELYEDADADDIKELIKSAPPELTISESAYNDVAEVMYEIGMISNPPKKFSELPNYSRIPKKE